MEKPKPCPFCAGTIVVDEDDKSFSAHCDDCNASPLTGPIGIGWFASREAAITAVNQRPGEKKLLARIAKLEAALERVIKILDRPMLKDEMCVNINHAVRVAHEALKGGE